MKTRDYLKELRELDREKLEEKLSATQEELMSLRFRQSSGQLEQSAQLKTLRRQIARIRTVQSKLESSSEATS